MARWLGLIYTTLAYVYFLGIVLYLIGFLTNQAVPRSIDAGGPNAGGIAGALIDVGLLALFAVQHSVMARGWFKRGWTKVVPAALERGTYVLVTNLALTLVFWQWRPLPARIWAVTNPLGAGVLWVIFAVGVVVAIAATFLINHFDFVGLRQAWIYVRRREYSYLPFSERVFYRFIRHPLMLGLLLAFWVTPFMTVGHALFAATFTVYILLGTQLEERDLARYLGAAYRDYQRRVPMLLPWRGARPLSKS
ncbi:MAG TPA: NnrU family protein [Ktedonobacterales bacterium]|jgi:protein-S-isoprenylcysteine O-methyltransferase Ste14